MKYFSVCSGIEAASCAWENLGWEPVGFSEIEQFPSAVLAHRYPGVKNYGDMTKYKEWENVGSIDLLVGGTPCFVPETLIISNRGLIPIKDIVVGDDVLTHKNRFRKVLRTGSKISNTIIVKGQGQSTGIETTEEHPFLSKIKKRVWVGRERGCWKSEMSIESWTAAKDMKGRMWASPCYWESSENPEIINKGREKDCVKMSDDLAWVIGRWLGDGWCRINERRGYVLICSGKHETELVEERLSKTGLHYSKNEERTTMRYQISNRALSRWLTENFGSSCYKKTMPIWVFGWKYRSSLFDGYISADGCKTHNGKRITTVSPFLALGAVLLAHSLGYSASRRLVYPNRRKTLIEGRSVNENPFWQITIYDRSKSSVIDGMHRWGLVRKVSKSGEEKKVYNIEVEEDNSYVADGICVHNCQSFSIAGLRKGLSDPRGNLMLTFGAIADHFKPRWIVWENVTGVLSSNGGRDFGTYLGMLAELGYGFAFRVLDAQFYGVAQRRRRVFVVGYLGDWRRAAAVLFDGESLSGNPSPSRTKKERFTGVTEKGTGSAVLYNTQPADSRITESKGVCDTVVARWGTGGGNIPLVMATGQGNAEISENQSPTLNCNHEAPILAIAGNTIVRKPENGGNGCGYQADISYTLTKTDEHGVMVGGIVRRLTPEECELLQGFPRNWTRIPWKGKSFEDCPDSPRYKACGNSMAVPVMRWIGERIQMVEEVSSEEHKKSS